MNTNDWSRNCRRSMMQFELQPKCCCWIWLILRGSRDFGHAPRTTSSWIRSMNQEQPKKKDSGWNWSKLFCRQFFLDQWPHVAFPHAWDVDVGLLGLADRFKNLKGAPTDADVEELRKFFPERNEPEWLSDTTLLWQFRETTNPGNCYCKRWVYGTLWYHKSVMNLLSKNGCNSCFELHFLSPNWGWWMSKRTWWTIYSMP